MLICDDVREELNGKFTLIGTYPDGISVSATPAQLSISLWITIRVSEKGTFPLHIKLNGPKENDELKISGLLKIDEVTGKPIIPLTFNIPINITGAGHIIISYSQDASDWKVLRTFPITVPNAQT